MPFSVLKISKSIDGPTEVAGEFRDEEDAQRFVEESQMTDMSDDHEYKVEAPPSQID